MFRFWWGGELQNAKNAPHWVQFLCSASGVRTEEGGADMRNATCESTHVSCVWMAEEARRGV